MKFTQEIKDNWLKNLRSGKYVQGFHRLKHLERINEENEDEEEVLTHCCIGVLGDSTEGLNNLDEANLFCPYYFLEKTIGDDLKKQLWMLNDNSEYKKTGKRDYSNVIPFIETLPVES